MFFLRPDISVLSPRLSPPLPVPRTLPLSPPRGIPPPVLPGGPLSVAEASALEVSVEDGFGGGATEAGLNANEELTLIEVCSLLPKSVRGRELCWPPRRCRLLWDV